MFSKFIIEQNKMKQNNNQAVIGLEIHVELKTKSKMFCHCAADYFSHQPNTHVCPVCLCLPGALPVANKQAIEWTIMAGLAFGCQISLFSKFDRKNYFYPDLPKGYQISQYDLPFCLDGKMGRIGIKRIHLEEDTAKLIHTKDSTLIDFNRSGVPLMEIVTEPDIESAQEAKEFLKQVQLINKGEKPIQETRGWDKSKQETYSQRLKEEAQDYRYFPEPDLPPIRWQKSEIERIKKLLPELPEARKRRFMEQYGLSDYQATISTASIAQSDYFEETINIGKEMGLDPVGTANVIINKRIDVDKTSPAKLSRILVEKRAVSKISDKQLGKIVKGVIRKNKQAVTDFKKGKTQAVEALLGQVMRATKGATNPNQTRKILLEQ